LTIFSQVRVWDIKYNTTTPTQRLRESMKEHKSAVTCIKVGAVVVTTTGETRTLHTVKVPGGIWTDYGRRRIFFFGGNSRFYHGAAKGFFRGQQW